MMTSVIYSQCWEDPRTLTEALAVGRQDDVVSIGSAGDNSLALLLNEPRSLTVVDANPAQIFLVELKIRAIETLDYDDFVGFLGARPCQDRERLYRYLRPRLSDQGRRYWDARGGDLVRGIIHCGKFERYLSTFRRHVLPFIHRKRTIRQMLAAASLSQQKLFYHEVWNNRRWRWAFQLFFGKFLLGHLGRDPSFFRYVTLDRVAEELLRRAQRGATELMIRDNFFIEYILTGEYGDAASAHPYLVESNFHLLRQAAGRVRLVRAGLRSYLEGLPPDAVSRFNLSDIFEYMSEGEFERTLRVILRACRDRARLAFWTLFVPRSVPAPLAGRIAPEPNRSDRLFAKDRGFFYGGFSLWDVPRAAAGGNGGYHGDG